MILWGVNAMNHDASITVVDTNTKGILFAGHAERYSRVKNDLDLNDALVEDALKHGQPDKIAWFENPWGRRLRYIKSGQWKLLGEKMPAAYMKQFGIEAPVWYSDHHASHAAGGYFTSGFDDAAILVIDAIGEVTTASIWEGRGNKIKKKWDLRYPHSLGLFYSAITHLVGLKPNEEEYILMGMAAYGDSEQAESLAQYMMMEYFKSPDSLQQTFNFHKGIRHDDVLNAAAASEGGRFALALAAQRIAEHYIGMLMDQASDLVDSPNLVYSGGVALNCVANSVCNSYFSKMWIMPNPGDAGNSLGACANYVREQLVWRGPFLGHNIDRPFDVDAVVDHLMTVGICGVATGRAEFGPRALGNRSLLADPRRPDMKDRVNEIKHRQKFRPFAPAVLSEHAHDVFTFPLGVESAPYMQYVVDVNEPEKYPAISHKDNTARVQTVDDESPILRAILQRWYEKTGCPVLLNTSLNIKGEPLVNSIEDAERWEKKYNVRVF